MSIINERIRNGIRKNVIAVVMKGDGV